MPKCVVDGLQVEACAQSNQAKRENSAAAFTGRIALFQIGLSPAQRRLLFSAGLREIDLPLPAGERLARFPDRLFPTGEIPE